MSQHHLGLRNEGAQRLQRVMLITRDRIAFCGPFGRPSSRCLGSWTFYLSPDQPFQLHEEGGGARSTRFALVAPWVTHRVVPAGRDLAVLLIEPDSVDAEAMCIELMGSPEARRRSARKIREGFMRDPAHAMDFDGHFFGHALPRRGLDHRIRQVIDLIAAPQASNLSAEQCASQVFLSSSRFMHLFSEQTQTTFRRFRGWKRARRFLTMLTGDPKLVEVALDAGYADSTHLSRCVRSCYGYTPAEMCRASRVLSVVARA